MVCNSTVSIDSDDKRQWASNDSLLSVHTLYHYAGNLLKGVPQQFSLPGLPCVTSLQSPTPVGALLTKAICSLHWLPCIPWQMITMLFSSTMSNDSYDKGGQACNDSLLTVRTLYHYASNLLKGAPQEFSLPGLPGVTSLQNVNEMVTLVTKFIYRLPWLSRVLW